MSEPPPPLLIRHSTTVDIEHDYPSPSASASQDSGSALSVGEQDEPIASVSITVAECCDLNGDINASYCVELSDGVRLLMRTHTISSTALSEGTSKEGPKLHLTWENEQHLINIFDFAHTLKLSVLEVNGDEKRHVAETAIVLSQELVSHNVDSWFLLHPFGKLRLRFQQKE